MLIARCLILALIGVSTLLTLTRLFLKRVGREETNVLAPAVMCALGACAGVELSRRDAVSHDLLLFMSGMAAVVALVGLLSSLRSSRRR